MYDIIHVYVLYQLLHRHVALEKIWTCRVIKMSVCIPVIVSVKAFSSLV